MRVASVVRSMWPWTIPLHASGPDLPLAPDFALPILGVSLLVLLVIAYVFYVDYRGVLA
jgi:hypothetical protein